MHRLRYLLVLAAAIGCSSSSGPYKTAAVSGRITLDGTPLANARVTFHPVHDPKDGALSGPESYGETDSDGKYSLTTVFKDRGATIGRNRVMVTTRKLQDDPDVDRVKKQKVLAPEKVPSKYSTDKAPLFFDVPTEGTSAANFDLTTK